KQIGLGTMMYIQDYDERFPYYNWGCHSCNENGNAGYPAGDDADGCPLGTMSATDPRFGAYSQAAWYNAIQPYVKNVGIFQDPSDRKQWRVSYCISFPASVYPTWQNSTWTSYAWNESASGRSQAAFSSPASDLLWSDYI